MDRMTVLAGRAIEVDLSGRGPRVSEDSEDEGGEAE
jgi:hypothetical protein